MTGRQAPWRNLLVDGLHLPHYAPPPSQHRHALYLIATVASAVKAGLVEEVCLLGLPVWCGRRLGWSPQTIVAFAVAVRVPFHLYYGWGALPVALWSLGLILCFLGLPVARVAPFVLAHICWDLPQDAKWALFVVLAFASPMLCAREDVRASNTLRAGWLLLTLDRRAGLQPESAGRVVGEDAAAADVPAGDLQ